MFTLAKSLSEHALSCLQTKESLQASHVSVKQRSERMTLITGVNCSDRLTQKISNGGKQRP